MKRFASFLIVTIFISLSFGVHAVFADTLEKDRQRLEQDIKQKTEELKKLEELAASKEKEERRLTWEKSLCDHFHLQGLTLCESSTMYRGMVESYGVCLGGKRLGDVHSVPEKEFTQAKLFEKVLRVLEKNNVAFTIDTPAVDRPPFVRAQMEGFEERYGRRFAWSQQFGWGEGLYVPASGRGIPFYWFVWSNTDGATQMVIDIPLFPIDMRWIRDTKDSLGRHWQVEVAESEAFTWINFTNDWIGERPYCQPDEKNGYQCDERRILGNYVIDGLLQFAFIKKMETKEYLK